MRFQETGLPGAQLIELEPVRDQRGYFQRTFCRHEFAARGMVESFVQHSTSHSGTKATLRGMHFQRAPYGEAKVVSCLQGAIWDVIVDLRTDSPTFRRWYGVELSPESHRQLYVPRGFAHGFQTLCDDAVVAYLISEFYTPSAAAGVRYNDPAFAIAWPLPVSVISEKDRSWPDFGG
jgi:dTDP-4-dehydrorhamnose 3,5-epimerase